MKLKLSEIKPNPNNPRIIKDDKFRKLVQSLQDFPEMLDAREIVINKDHIILGGNMRFKAAKEAGFKEVPVKVVDWPEDKQRQFVIKDNVSGGEWDWDVLANDFDAEELDAWGLDTPDDWGEDKEVEEDEAPEVDESEPPKSKLGEIYQLGRHRVMCADSTVKENVEKLMDGNKADMVFTDPPYGMDLDTDYTAMNGTLRDGSHVDRNKHDRVIGDGDDFNPLFISNIFNHFGYCKEMFLWGADYYAELIPERNNGSWVIWDKTGDETKDKGFGSSFETCWSRQKHKRTFARIWWQGIFGVKDDQKGRVHPTQKPVQLADWFFKRWGDGLNIVADLFLGSGSTLIACEQTDRTCYGMELDPKYVDVIRKRYWKFVNGSEEGWEDGTPAV